MDMTYWDNSDIDENYHFQEREDLKILADMIVKEDKCKSLIEFGTGTGIFPVMLRKMDWQGEYIGSDYSDKFINASKKHNPDEQFVKADLLKLPLPFVNKNIEACVAIHSLDYVYPYESVLFEFKRIATKFIYLDFWQDLWDKPNRIKFNEEGKWGVNVYNRKEFEDVLRCVGLKIDKEIFNSNLHSKTNRIFRLKV